VAFRYYNNFNLKKVSTFVVKYNIKVDMELVVPNGCKIKS
jgi:hypothetical protein